MKEQDRLGRDLFLSFTLHALFWALVMLMPDPPKHEAPVTFEVLPKEDPRLQKTVSRSVVRDTQVPDSQKIDSKDPAQFLSDKTQRVREQTKAAQSGLTANRQNVTSTPSPPAPSTSKPQSSDANKKPPSADGLARFIPHESITPAHKNEQKTDSKSTQEQSQPTKNQVNLNPGFSTLAEDLQTDAKIGDITALNTDRYLYYSYFARAQELLWNEWSPRVQNALQRPPAALHGSPRNKYMTVVEVWFLPSGQVHSTHILKPSGIPEFDRIAEASFHALRMIPNPPKERVESDGLIRFTWGMSVEYDPRAYVR